MKKLFYIGLIGLGLFEILKVYFIMPMPGSQQAETIDIAYLMHTNRWIIRALFGVMALAGIREASTVRRWWLPMIALVLVGFIVYYFNFKMMADKMFLEPSFISFSGKEQYPLGDTSLVIAVEHSGEAKAYPVRYIVYHHQVRDTVGGKPVMVTYCSVCRTGRVFEPIVNGRPENFRLVGMDHFNAMFEDSETGSWWRQVTGEAVAGPLTGQVLPEVESMQLSAGKFFMMYPFGKIMDPDKASTRFYDSLGRYERGKSKSALTGTDSASWKDKSWVIGIQIGSVSKAYDWNQLKQQRVINDKLNDTPVVVAISDDGQSFTAFQRPNENDLFSIQSDTLKATSAQYDFSGRPTVDGVPALKRIPVYQEFWHSWRTFHPETLR